MEFSSTPRRATSEALDKALLLVPGVGPVSHHPWPPTIRGRPARWIAQRPADRSPHIDDLEAMAKQLFGFLAHQVADPLRAGFYRIVVVDTGHRLARGPS